MTVCGQSLDQDRRLASPRMWFDGSGLFHVACHLSQRRLTVHTVDNRKGAVLAERSD